VNSYVVVSAQVNGDRRPVGRVAELVVSGITAGRRGVKICYCLAVNCQCNTLSVSNLSVRGRAQAWCCTFFIPFVPLELFWLRAWLNSADTTHQAVFTAHRHVILDTPVFELCSQAPVQTVHEHGLWTPVVCTHLYVGYINFLLPRLMISSSIKRNLKSRWNLVAKY